MAELKPGQVLREFRTKSGQHALLRILQESDAKELKDYINELSAEDTFVAYSGEKVTLKEEKDIIKTRLSSLKKGNCVPVVCEINGRMASNCRVGRKLSMKKRARHIAVIVISVRKEFRGEGIGKECMKELITQAKNIEGVDTLKLTAFEENKHAIRLYEKSGFKVIGRLPKQYLYKGKYQGSVIMQRDLQA